MAGNTSVILVRVLGNTRGLTRSLKKANDSLGGLQRMSSAITGALKVAAIAAVGFGAAAVGAAAAGAVALAGMAAGILGIGIAFAAQNKRVKKAFDGLKGHVVKVMRDITKPLVGPLVRGMKILRTAFDEIAPALRRIFRAGAPVVDAIFITLGNLAKPLGRMMENAFKAGVPVLLAFMGGLDNVVKGMNGFFKALGRSTGTFAEFATSLMEGVGRLLPAVGRLLAALAPIGTAILQTVLPALVDLINYLARNVGPAVQKVTAFFERHKTAAKAVGFALIGLVVTIKAVQVALAVASAAAMVFRGVALTIRAAIIVWKNAQLALNLAMMLNPIGLVIAAIVALVAIFVIAWKKSETFRRIVKKAWGGIKRATKAVWEWLKSATKKAWDFVKKVFLNFTGPGLVIKHWDKIKRVTKAVWSWLKATTKKVWNGLRSTIAKVVNGIRTFVAGGWNRLRSVTRTVWNALKSVVGGAIRAVLSTVRNVLGNVRRIVRDVWQWVSGTTRNFWRNIVDWVRYFVERLVYRVATIRNRVIRVVSGAWRWMLSAGKDLIRGLINGVVSMAGTLINKVKDVVGNAIQGAKNLLGIGSPSKLFRQYGRWVGDGLAIGLKERAGLAAKAATGLAREVADGFGAPQLALDARPALVGSSGSALGNTYNLNVTVPVGASPADTGREIVKAIEAYERRGGRRR